MTFDESRRSNLLSLASLAMAAAVPGCGGGGGAGETGGASATLVTLELTTPLTTVPPGQSVSLSALARFSDGAGTALGSLANWKSSNPAVATVNGDGRVTAVADGSATITASYQSTSASLTLRVGQPVRSLELLPLPFRLALALGGTWQLSTLGHAATGTTDVRAVALWSSSSLGVATVGQGNDGGLVRGVGPGTTTISCQLDGFTATARITVLAHQRIAHSDTDSLALQCVTAADSSGRALAVWSRGFRSGGRPDLSWSQFRTGAGWSAEASLRPLPLAVDARSSSLTLSLQESGIGWAAWQQPDGLFAARFDPVSGWEAPVRVDPTGTSFGSSLSPLALQVDRNGNALLVWNAYVDSTTQFWFSALDGSSGRWTPASAIADTQVGGLLRWWKLASNQHGDATLLWVSQEVSPTGSDTRLLAVPWQPAAAGRAGGWLSRETLISGVGLPNNPTACMDDAGATLVAWIQGTGRSSATGRPIETLLSRRRLPGKGWQAEQIMVAETDHYPRQLSLAAAAGQGAGALWANGWDAAVQAARMTDDGRWSVLGEASDNSHPLAEVGDPAQLEVTQLSDGRLLFSWLASDNFIGGVLATRVHNPTSGWSSVRRDTAPGRVGSVQCMSLAYTASGLGVAAWLDSNQSGSDFFGHAGWQP